MTRMADHKRKKKKKNRKQRARAGKIRQRLLSLERQWRDALVVLMLSLWPPVTKQMQEQLLPKVFLFNSIPETSFRSPKVGVLGANVAS